MTIRPEMSLLLSTRLNFFISFFFFRRTTKKKQKIFSLFTTGNMHSQIERIISWFNNTVYLIFKHEEIWTERKRYKLRKERNIAT